MLYPLPTYIGSDQYACGICRKTIDQTNNINVTYKCCEKCAERLSSRQLFVITPEDHANANTTRQYDEIFDEHRTYCFIKEKFCHGIILEDIQYTVIHDEDKDHVDLWSVYALIYKENGYTDEFFGEEEFGENRRLVILIEPLKAPKTPPEIEAYIEAINASL